MRSVAIWYDVLICREKFESSKTKWRFLRPILDDFFESASDNILFSFLNT